MSSAHRLNTIMDSTRVMVLDNGYLAEFDTPHNLLSKPSGGHGRQQTRRAIRRPIDS